MRFIPTRVHGILDYLTAILLIALPWILGLSDQGLERWLPIVLGVGVLLYSVLTRYELGLFKVIPMPAHLGLDIAGGLVLAASPWLFGFSEQARIPFLVIGIFEVIVSLLSQTAPHRLNETAVGHAD
jgi:hypothetical protein